MKLDEFLTIYSPQFEEKIARAMEATYQLRDDHCDFGSQLDPYPLQREVVRALAEGFKTKKSLYLIGETGCGKTHIIAWAAEHMKAKRTLVVCPPHLLEQWSDMIRDSYPEKRIRMIPNDEDRKKGISDLRALQIAHEKADFDFLIISREAIKSDLAKLPAYVMRMDPLETEEGGKNKRALGNPTKKSVKKRPACPVCYTTFDMPVNDNTKWGKMKCEHCKSPLYSQARQRGTRPSLAKYIKQKMRSFFSLVTFDEAHELKSGSSLQGEALGRLAGVAPSVSMTGTFMGGMATDVFFLIYRTNPGDLVRAGFKYSDCREFIARYGAQEKIERPDEAFGSRRKIKTIYRTRPGISPRFVGDFLLDKAVFLRLQDFAEHLPVLKEHPVRCEMHPRLLDAYAEFQAKYQGLKKMEGRLRSSLTHTMLAWPDWHGEERIIKIDSSGNESVAINMPSVELPIGATEKEQRLLEIVGKAKSEGRKVIVYTNQTKKRDLLPRIGTLLMEYGHRAAVMRADISTRDRLSWIQKKTPHVDALIMHPRLVATGANLLEFPVIVFFDLGMSVYTTRQAAKRSMRLSQEADEVSIHYMYTDNTAQKDLLSLMAKKIEVSLMVEGDVSDGSGLAAMTAGGDSLTNDLAKAISGELKTESPLEVFSRVNKLNNEGKPARIKRESRIITTPQIVVPVTDTIVSVEALPVVATTFTKYGQACLPY